MKFNFLKSRSCFLKSALLMLVFGLTTAYAGKTLTICKNDGVRFITIPDPTTGAYPDIVLWTIQGGDISSSNLLTTNPVYYNTAGQYKTYNESTFTSTGQTQYDTFIVIVRDWPIPSFYFPKDTGYCNGSTFSLTLNTTTFPGVKYEWNTGETTSSIIANTIGKYWVKVTIPSDFKTRTCDSVYKEVNIVEYTSPVVNLGNDKTMCQNQIIQLNAKGGAGYKYLWNPTGEVTQQITSTFPGIYSVEVTSPDNCKATDEIELIDSCPHIIYIPDAVSPNADLLNDVFVKIWNFTPKDYNFTVYNRWGELLFETTDLNAGWDCKVNSELVQQDIYVYKISYIDTDKKYYELRGTFFVVR